MKDTFELKLGIVGTGTIVDNIISSTKLDPRIKLTALYSRTEERAREFSQKHYIEHTFTSLEEMAASPLIDAVYIASPNSCHAEQSILFMKHGKHVLCEKPFASNAREAKQMIESSQANQVCLMEAIRSTPSANFLALKDRLKDIGPVRRYFASYCQYSSRYDLLKEGIVMNAFKPELSNGALLDIGVYTIHPMVALFGKPLKIEAMASLLETGVDGQGVINFEYPGMLATVLYSKIASSSLPSEIQGENGIILLDSINIMSQVELILKASPEHTQRELISTPITERDQFYEHELREFVDTIASGNTESKLNSHENSYLTMQIMDEVRQQIKLSYPADLL